MSNYAIQIPGDGSSFATTGTLTDVKNATALGITARIRGDRFTALTVGSAQKAMYQLAAGYLVIYTFLNAVTNDMTISVASAVDGETLHSATAINISSFSASAYYLIKAYWDTAATPHQSIEVYDSGGTLLTSGSASNTTAISNGTFGDVTFNKSAGQGVNNDAPLTTDWLAVWSAAPPSGAPTQPTVGTTNLLRLYLCDDGSGSTITESVDNTTGNASITGSFTWILISGGGSVLVEDMAMQPVPPMLMPVWEQPIVTVFG